MKILYSLIVVLFVSIFFNSGFAQKIKHKFGKLNPGEAEMSYYEPDSSASAVILFDKGYSHFEYDNNTGFKIIFQKNLRIKIFKKDAFDNANFEIPLYIGSSGREESLYSIKGKTFNSENGKIISVKVSKENIFYDNKSKHLKIAKISFPNIKEGSIIDLEYKISSDFIFNLRGWQFQYEIPVKYSEYSVLIPEYFKYHRNQKGYDNIILDQKIEKRSETIQIGSYNINSLSEMMTWKATEIPAFVKEPYITTTNNYMTALEFELNTISYPNEPIEYYTTSWENVNKKLLKNSYFGLQLKPTKKVKLKAEEICTDLNSDIEKMTAIYYWITHNIKWNGYNSKYIKNKLNDVLKEKKGNVADINILLLTMLKSQGINVNPVILSTRKHGMIFPAHPSMSVFNYVITEVKIHDNIYYLDATDENLPIGMLPFRCLNGIGRIVGMTDSNEIQIKPSQKHSESYLYSLSINPSEGISGTVNCIYKAYAAYEMRNNIENKGGEEEYITMMTDNSENMEISDVTYSNLKEKDKPLKESYNFSTNDNITFAGNMIYLTPLLDKTKTNNPFKLEDRKYPVDYGYPIIEKITIQYIVPEGYELSEKPENAVYALPGRTAQFQYQISTAGNILQVISIFKINKPVFQYDSYKALKKFYDLVIKKQNEKIVLKKI